ncbi:hypothetical protein EBB59_02510 [Lysobacter pythonis]|uniref:Uncharacterized protein n=2 Tax=Solilutibacter pythonis TaxID=2483112 RepID=A0A3M2I0Z4_9GAMM|nr:hypothetical protein EBB59_02510 [Lysobacter pythonis]
MGLVAILWPLLLAAILLCMLWGGLKFAQQRGWLSRWSGKGLDRQMEAPVMKIVGRRALSPKTTLHLVDVDGGRFMIVESNVSIQVSRTLHAVARDDAT